MNVIPLLDVLLVLVLILMGTMPMVSQTVQVDLPRNSHVTASAFLSGKQQVIIEISAVGEYHIIVNGQRSEKLSEQCLLLQVKELLKREDAELLLFLIGGAASVPYEEIIKGLSVLQRTGVATIGLMTQPLLE